MEGLEAEDVVVKKERMVVVQWRLVGHLRATVYTHADARPPTTPINPPIAALATAAAPCTALGRVPNVESTVTAFLSFLLQCISSSASVWTGSGQRSLRSRYVPEISTNPQSSPHLFSR